MQLSGCSAAVGPCLHADEVGGATDDPMISRAFSDTAVSMRCKLAWPPALCLTALLAACGGEDPATRDAEQDASSGGADAATSEAELSLKLVTPSGPFDPGQSVTLSWEVNDDAQITLQYEDKQVSRTSSASETILMGFSDVEIKVSATLGEERAEESVTLETTAAQASEAQYSSAAGAAAAPRYFSGVAQEGDYTPSGYWTVEVPEGGMLSFRWPERGGQCLQSWGVRVHMVDGPRVGPAGTYAAMLSSGGCDWAGGADSVSPLLRNMTAGTYSFAPALSADAAGEAYELEQLVQASLLSRCGDGVVQYANREACEPPGTDSCSASCKPTAAAATPSAGADQALGASFNIDGKATEALKISPATDLQLTRLSFSAPAGELWLALLDSNGAALWEQLSPLAADTPVTPNVRLSGGQSYYLLSSRSTVAAMSGVQFTASWATPDLSEHAVEHLRGDQQHQHAEELAQQLDVEPVGQAHAERRAERGAEHHRGEGWQIHKAEAAGRQAGGAPATDDVPDRTRQRDRQADRGRAADRLVQPHPAGQIGHAHSAAADAEQATDEADAPADGEQAEPPRDGPGLAGDRAAEHLLADEDQKAGEEQLQRAGGQLGGEQGAGEGADEDPRPDGGEQIPAHRPAAVVRPGAGGGGDDDAGQRGAERDVHDLGRGHAHVREHDAQRGHQDRPAPDTEQPGEQADEGPDAQEQQQAPGRDLREELHQRHTRCTLRTANIEPARPSSAPASTSPKASRSGEKWRWISVT